MALDKEDAKLLAEAIREGNGGNSKPTQSAGGDVGGLLDKVKTGLGDLGATITPLYAGFQRLTGASSGAASVLEGFSKVAGSIGLGGFGSAVEQVGNSLLKNKAQMDEAGKIGVGGNDLGKFNRMAAESGQKVGEFTDTIVNFKGGLNGLAGSAQRSAETFSKLSGEIQQGESGKQLRALGIESNELANITALSVQNSKKLNLDDNETRARAKASANELALQLAETALTTGMNRDAILNSVKAEQEKPKVMLAMLAMDEQQRQNFTKTQASLAALGPTTQALASEIVSGGIRTKEGMAAMTALGPAGEQLQRAIKQQQEAKTEEQKAAAKEALEDAKTAVNTRMASKEYGQIANTATGATAEAMAKMAGENKSLMGSIAATQEAGGDAKKAAANQKAEADAALAGMKVDKDGKSTGQDDPGKKLSQTINEFDRLTNIQAAGLARNLETVNNKLGASPAAIQKFNEALDLVGGKTSKRDKAETYNQAEAQQKGVVDDVQGEIKKFTGGLNQGNARETQEMIDRNNRPGQKLPRPGTRDGGTLEKTGSPVEPEDAIVKIHKGETVLTPEATANAGKQLAGASQTINETLAPASSPNEGKGADKGALEATLSDYQKTVLKYAATEGEMKQVQLDNEKNIISGAEINILENKQRIAEIEKDADGRELTRREQSRIERIQAEIQGQEESLARHKEALSVYENIDALSNQTVVESKKAASEDTMASLKEQEEAGYAANRAAVAARDALEEKAELEGRAMTEAEEAQYKLLGVELNASSNKITAAQEAQKAFEESQRVEAAAAKLASFEKINALEIEAFRKEQYSQVSLEETERAAELEAFRIQQVTGGVAETVKAVQEEVKIKGESAKSVDIKSQMEGMFSKIGGGGGILGDMFNPKIIDTKLAEANKVKLAEVKKEEPKATTPAAKPAEKSAESKQTDKEIGIKDLNDQLKMLNMNMLKLISHSETISGASEKTAKNSAKATGNRYA